MTTKYDAEKKVTYTNFKIFSFDEVTDEPAGQNSTEPEKSVDNGEPGGDPGGNKLPW